MPGLDRSACARSFSRRDALELGAQRVCGISLAGLMAARGATLSGAEPGGATGADGATSSSFGKARSCILLFKFGGPAQVDTFDMKPRAPLNVRGEFKPIATTVPGLQVCEHLSRVARQAHRLAIVRSVHHESTQHNDSAYIALTGYRGPPQPDSVATIRAPTPDDLPPFGAAVARMRSSSLPWVSLPLEMRDNHATPGQTAGFLDARCEPLRLINADPNAPGFAFDELELGQQMSGERVSRRRGLLERLSGELLTAGAAPAGIAAEMGIFQHRALDLLGSAAIRDAFHLQAEPAAGRERYGRSKRGQCVLLARRLIEAGVPLVTVYDGGPAPMDGWDTHYDNFKHLKDRLLPADDISFAALLEDLADRGLLDETLVVWMGEFGRSPKVNDAGGRDHWPYVYTVVFAGGGVPGGTIYGASDRVGGSPAEAPVTPQDIAATIYHQLGIDPQSLIYDRQNRPLPVASGGQAIWG